jgi:hypothetical protein
MKPNCCYRPTQRAPDVATAPRDAGGSRRVFKQFGRLETGSGKVALSCPAWWLSRVETHQRVTQTVGRQPQKLVQVITFGCPVIIKSVCFRK